MRINRNNYEAFLLDQLEGRLSAEEARELDKFLLLNPDCASDLTELEPWVLDRERIPFHTHEILKKEFPDHGSVPGKHNFDMFSIARMEGDLGEEQIQTHQAMLEADDQKAIQWKQWQLTRLEAEPVLFAAKDRLRHKKSINGRMIWIPLIPAAAAIASLILLLSRTPDLPQREISFQALQEGNVGQNPHQEYDLKNLFTETAPDQDRTFPAQQNPVELSEKQADIHPENKEPVLSLESLAILKEEPRNPVNPAPLTFSVNQFNQHSMAREADPDQIKPLLMPPVTVPNGRMTVEQLSEMGLQGIIAEYAKEKDLSFLKIAHAGINGINRLAGSDISLMASQDEDGELSGFQIKSKRFSLTRPVHRDE